MNIVLTGSIGRISGPLARKLLQKGNSVTIISRNAEKQKEIESLGAKSAIGSIEDPGFLADTFSGADIVYLMIPPVNFFDPNLNMISAYSNAAQNYVEAIRQSGVNKIVHLSTIGAHTQNGVGMLRYGFEVEKILSGLPGNVSIKTMRPVGFYYNMFFYIPTIKHANAIIQNYGGDEKEPWVSPLDIAAVIAEEMEKPFSGRTVRYIASEEISPNELAGLLGNAIGKPDLEWRTVSDEEFTGNLVRAGFGRAVAEEYTQMNAGRRSGVLYEDYYRHHPTLGSTKLKVFANEFAAVYNSK